MTFKIKTEPLRVEGYYHPSTRQIVLTKNKHRLDAILSTTDHVELIFTFEKGAEIPLTFHVRRIK